MTKIFLAVSLLFLTGCEVVVTGGAFRGELSDGLMITRVEMDDFKIIIPIQGMVISNPKEHQVSYTVEVMY